ncbi:MAG: hypothetical protein CMM07_02255 [Rhodopirellula sp.]|nr:hypothetical protein [Rhodopirellula sp.]
MIGKNEGCDYDNLAALTEQCRTSAWLKLSHQDCKGTPCRARRNVRVDKSWTAVFRSLFWFIA